MTQDVTTKYDGMCEFFGEIANGVDYNEAGTRKIVPFVCNAS
jgi:hypothetical protein